MKDNPDGLHCIVVVDLLQWQSEAVLQLLMSGVWLGRNFGKMRRKTDILRQTANKILVETVYCQYCVPRLSWLPVLSLKCEMCRKNQIFHIMYSSH